MLARVGSGKSGIGEYLETGRKKGRENGRDEIDERMVFEGDIDTLESVIASHVGDEDADRYIHITLGFAEQFTGAAACGPGEINFAKMQEVAAAYKEMLMSAYGADEYCWYAEAHIPKVTHDIHAVTGETIERLPHIHIVYPKINLIDGTYLNPANTGKKNESYLQAIQETINEQFGLKSPLDSFRQAAEAPLARHNPEFSKPSATQIREELLEDIKAGRITSFDDLVASSERFGVVRVRQGSKGDYINIKPDGAPNGINVKEFTRQGFAVQVANASSGQTKVNNFKEIAKHWTEKGAFEARYAVGGFHAKYQSLSKQDKAVWLQAKINRTSNRVASARGETVDQPIEYKAKRNDPGSQHREQQTRKNSRAAGGIYKSNISKFERLLPPAQIDGVQHLSSVRVVHVAEFSEVLLFDNAPNHMGKENPGNSDVRREGGGPGGMGSREGATGGRVKKTVASTFKAQVRPEGPTANQLKNDTNPNFVLEAAVKLYQLDPAKYSITSGQDGTPRILHDEKQYNLGDFFTKHLSVSWIEAQEVLKPCYYQTLAEALPAPDTALWHGFREWERTAKIEGVDTAAEFVKIRAELAAVRSQFKETRAKVQAMPSPPKGRPKGGAKRDPRLQKSSLMALARAEQIVKIAAIEKKVEAINSVAKPKQSRSAMYRQFLTELASKGNTKALNELRRAAKPDPEMKSTITGSTSKAVFAQPNYSVDHAGAVTYFQSALSAVSRTNPLVTDSTKGVAVVAVDPAAYAIALKVAVARYGPTLTLTGDATFMKGMADAAKSQKMNVTLKNSATPQAKPLIVNGRNMDIGDR